MDIGKVIAQFRKERKMTQSALADELTERGLPVRPPSVSAWEKGVNHMSAEQFLAACDILGIDDINLTFDVATGDSPVQLLNKKGRERIAEYASLLARDGRFVRRSASAEMIPMPRMIRIYDQAASAGTGEFTDSDSYELYSADSSVPDSVSFGVRIAGDSMEPLIPNHSVVWVHAQDSLESGEVGIFYVSPDVYCKRLRVSDGRTQLLSENAEYAPIDIAPGDTVRIFGRVVGVMGEGRA